MNAVKFEYKYWVKEYKLIQKYINHLGNKDKDVLKIGNGFGYATEIIRPYTKSLETYDIQFYPLTINQDKVKLYDGKKLPMSSKSIDISVLSLTLHHIPNNLEFLKEIANITRNRIVLVEETYDNFFQKLHLVWRDWHQNIFAGQYCKIYWNSYLKRNNIEQICKHLNLKIVERQTFKHHSYFRELLVLEVDDKYRISS